jgi:collagenase-like PrtC family protease
MKNKRIELLAPAGSMANLKAAVSKGADAVYLGMKDFSARSSATNFDNQELKHAIDICKSNNVKLYLTMNTLVKNKELQSFFDQLSVAYSCGIDAIILQEIYFIDLIKNNFPDLRVHVSTQAGVMNSEHAKLLSNANRITLARELTEPEIINIRKNTSRELEMFCHGALCVCVSGQCLFSSFLGGRSGNRGKCARPCRKQYNGRYYLSTRELSLIKEIPKIINTGVNSVKIEGRMRTPRYVATATSIYRKAIDSYYENGHGVDSKDLELLNKIFTREFTKGWFNNSKDIINAEFSSAKTEKIREHYHVDSKHYSCKRNNVTVKVPEFSISKNIDKQLLVKVYSKKDAILASEAGADIIYFDIFNDDFRSVKKEIKCKLFASIPQLVFDKDIQLIKQKLKENKPDGVLLGNIGLLNEVLEYKIHLNYNINVFNELSLEFLNAKGIIPLLSPELSIRDMALFQNKDCAVFVHGKIKLMTLRHHIKKGILSDSKGNFNVEPTYNGTDIFNEKEMGLLSKASHLVKAGFNRLYIDTERNVSEIVKAYRNILDGRKIDDKNLKKDYVLGWAYRGVL